MGKRLTASICDGVRGAMEDLLVAGSVEGHQVALDYWYDAGANREWHGLKVQRECARIHRLLVDYLAQIERGDV